MLVAASALFAAALWIGRARLATAFDPVTWSRRREATLLALVLFAFLLTHFLAVGRQPYGVEGDESSWVHKVVEARAEDDPERYHFHLIPTTYWLQNQSNDLLGIDIANVRFSVAVLGFVATLVFYAATRTMANAPVALLATALMAFSIVDFAAGRQAHPEAYVKIFGVLGAAGVLFGYARRQSGWFVLAGIALGLGLWTYDSFALAPIGIVGYALFRFAREPRRWLFHLTCLVCLTVPLAAMAVRVKPYLDGRRDAQVSVLATAIGGYPSSSAGWVGAAPRLSRFVAEQAVIAYERVTHQGLKDVLIGREGPIESAAYVPLVALGAMAALCFVRRGQLAFPLFWVGLPAFPTVLLLGQAFARTLLPYWGGFLMLAAYTLWLSHLLIVDALGNRWVKWVGAALVAFLVAVGVANAYVSFNELYDPDQRQLRRALGERLQRYSAPDNRVLMPFVELAQDYFDLERWYTRYAVAGRVPWGQESSFYRQVPLQHLFEEVRAAFTDRARVTVLYDRSIATPGARAEVLAALERCLPGHTLESGRWIDAYVVTREAYARRACDLGAAIELVAPSGTSEPAGEPLDLVWRLDGSEQTEYELELERHDDRVVWLEAEEFSSRDGWKTEGHLASGFSGHAYLADERADWRPLVSARHALRVAVPGGYAVWARVYRRRDDGGPIRLEVGGRSFELALVPPDQFDRWLWQRVGEVTLEGGTAEMTLTRSYPGEEAGVVFQIFLDALVFAPASFDPGQATDWTAVLHTGRVASSETRHRHTAGLPVGRYRWRVRLRNQERLVDWKGTPEVTSDRAEFEVVTR